MKDQIIFDDEGGGHYRIFDSGDFEYENPIDLYRKMHIQSSVGILTDMLGMSGLPINDSLVGKIIFKKAIQSWNKLHQEIRSTGFPSQFEELLSCQKKRKQIRLLKGQSWNVLDQLAFYFKAFEQYNFTLSQYKSEQYVKGINPEDLPRLLSVEDNEVKKIGETLLSDGQLRHAVNFRKAVVAKVLDNGDNWHCFYVTYKSIGGKESWKEGQPHYHYISSKFGITRDKLVKKLKSGKYPSSPVHIDLLRYSRQNKKRHK